MLVGYFSALLLSEENQMFFPPSNSTHSPIKCDRQVTECSDFGEHSKKKGSHGLGKRHFKNLILMQISTLMFLLHTNFISAAAFSTCSPSAQIDISSPGHVCTGNIKIKMIRWQLPKTPQNTVYLASCIPVHQFEEGRVLRLQILHNCYTLTILCVYIYSLCNNIYILEAQCAKLRGPVH